MSRKTLERLFNLQSGMCALCAMPMKLGFHNQHGVSFRPDINDASIDHVTPRAMRAGRSEIRAVHRGCNLAKADRLVQPFPLACFEAQP